MRATITIPVSDVNLLGDQLCRWISNEKFGMVLRSNLYNFGDPLQESLKRYELIAATGINEIIEPTNKHFEVLQDKIKDSDWLFGYLGYDLKNQVENLTSNNPDGLEFSDMLFVKPELVFTVNKDLLTIHYLKSNHTEQSIADIYSRIMLTPRVEMKHDSSIEFNEKYTKDEYIDTIQHLLSHIQRGDIYEMNLCQEFYSTPCEMNPYETFINLNRISPTPFSAFGRFGDKFLICASPERFLQKTNETIISQPIKGTCPRGKTQEEDFLLRNELQKNIKERSENVMIVDLVRNDLSRVAQKASVKVDELCGIYPFRQVNQMISTISCRLKEDKNIVDLLKATFPMGSMTGAPKIRAMELIEKYERSKRGLFSGSVGYISPQGNLDFNVVIRSLLYNGKKKYLSYTVRVAITAKSDPESEYQESILKASAIRQTLQKLPDHEIKV